MPLLLVQLGAFPQEIAATKTGECKKGGAFFLDFARPLHRLRWLGAWNRWVGITLSLVVPVRHQGQHVGQHVIAVDRGDPYFKEVQRLWRERYAAGVPVGRLAAEASDAEVQVDFKLQFPEDGRGNGQ